MYPFVNWSIQTGREYDPMRERDVDFRVWMLIAMFVAALAAASSVDPIPQDPGYHAFADTRGLLGIPNLADTFSNIGFAVAGLLGMRIVVGIGGRRRFPERIDALPYLLFFAGVACVGAGSAYYHLAPDTTRLFWDRLPMTVAFMSLFSAILADRVHREAATRYLLPLLIAAGVFSLMYWDMTEVKGHGDLRFYGFVQFFPVLALPLILWLFPRGRYTAGPYLLWVVLWYAAAKLLEYFDHEVFVLTGQLVSGHSLKHLAAAIAVFVVLRMLRVNTRYSLPSE